MSKMKEARAPDGANPARNDTVSQQGGNQAPKPRTPNEHDESADSQAPAEASQRRIGEIAHDDVEEGLRDTDKGPVLDATYQKQK